MALLSPDTEAEPIVAQVGLDTGTGSALKVEEETRSGSRRLGEQCRTAEAPLRPASRVTASLPQTLGKMAELGPHDLGLHRRNSSDRSLSDL